MITLKEVEQLLAVIDSTGASLEVEVDGLYLRVIRRGEEEEIGDAPNTANDTSIERPELRTVEPIIPGNDSSFDEELENHSVSTSKPKTDEGRTDVEPVIAPLAGIFYRRSSPQGPLFVEVGDRVEPSDTVGIIEVMKLFTSVKAGVAGRVTEVLVSDADTVTRGQPLLLLVPDSKSEGGR